MQGGNASTEVKWQTGVLNLLTNGGLDAICLQEAGAVPASANPLLYVDLPAPGGGVERVYVYSWGGTQSRPYGYILFHNWDTGGNRVNTAIVLKQAVAPVATDVLLLWPAGGATWRPALGVRTNNICLLSFHAISPNGPDGAGMLAAISAAAGGHPWCVGADWNRTPNTLGLPPGSSLCPPNGSTYSSQQPVSMYDYFVCSGAPGVLGQVQSLLLSDHLPVIYNF